MKKDIESLLNDKEFCRKILALDNLEYISKVAKDYDYDISSDEFSQIETFFKKIKDNKLSDEELEAVAGGAIPRSLCSSKPKSNAGSTS